MKASLMKGIAFGLTSGVITTLGLMVGLNSFTGSKMVVLGGILTIAIADAFSDALGIHMSEESESKNHKEVWKATISTFISKIIFASTFLIPVLLFELPLAITISIIWGLLVLGILSYYIARSKKEKPLKVILEHIIIAIVVIVLAYLIGQWIGTIFL